MKREDLDLVNRYLDGALTEHESMTFKGRLSSEPGLREYVEGMNSLLRVAGELDVFKAPDVNFPVLTRFPRFSMNLGLGSFLAGAAVAAACILILIGVGSKPGRLPIVVTPIQNFRMIYYAPEATSVSVLGDFNGWSGEIPLKPKGEGGFWIVEIPVTPGEYSYVLLVDGQKKAGDPMADYVINDDFGSKNSVVRIGL